jgi:pyruvate dehydrogenase E1 component beta subunit
MKKITIREAIREALVEEMMRDQDVILIGEDIGRYGGTLQVTAGIWDQFEVNVCWIHPCRNPQ